jgi:hypothetical protein
VDAETALADQPVGVRVSGLRAGATVVVASQAADLEGRLWRGEATFTEDGDGVIDLNRSEAVSGTYRGVDSRGLFWSMRPPTGDPGHAWFSPGLPEVAGEFKVRLTVTAAGREIAARALTRQWTATGVTHRTFTVAADALAGVVLLPPPGAVRRPGVLVLGGVRGRCAA